MRSTSHDPPSQDVVSFTSALGSCGTPESWALATAVLSEMQSKAAWPQEKVMSMLADVQMKLVEDGKTSEVTYANYSQFCSHGQRDLGYDIKDAQKNVEQLTATIAKTSSEIDVATSKLEELQAAMGKSEVDLKEAQDLRSKEHKEHQNARSELGEASDMLGRAIKTLSAKVRPSLLQQKVDNDNDAALLKALGAVVDAASIPNKERESLMSFVESQNYIAREGPKSESIVSILEDMKTKARDELNSMATAEKQSLHSFLMLKQSLEMQMSAARKEMEQTTLVKATAQQEKAVAEADLAGTQQDQWIGCCQDLTNDEKSLQKLEQSCQQATRDYEDSSKTRAEEMEALKKAEKVLAEKTGATIQTKAALLQIRSHGSDVDSFEVVKIMRSLAQKTPADRSMETFAENVESLMQTSDSAPGVMDKVKDMIENMIASKKKEAASEQTKKAYCDEEQSKTKAKLEELTSKKDSLSAKVDKKTSESETLKKEAVTLQKELGELSELQVEMDQRRQEEEVAFKQQKTDLQSALEGVRTAISVLRDYYSTSGTSGAASGGIVSMLEVIESDFGRSLAQAESQETSRAEEHDSMSQQSKLTEVQKDADQKFKTKTSTDLDKAVLELAADTETAQEELAAILTYQESLAKQCFDGGMSHEERKAQREEEIKGLKDALSALNSEPVLLQSKLRGAMVKPHRA
eukprot:Skav220987  [mRNA]  locus=scaffold1541:179018:194613:+ [translate_table: standard]